MTAEPRDVEEIRADLAALEDAGPVEDYDDRIYVDGLTDQLLADVEPLLARLAAADRENAELRGEVERLRGVMHDWAGEMGSAAGRIERLEARSAQLERVEWLIDHADAFTGPHIHVDSLRAALSAAPQPEPVPPARSSNVGGWASDAELAEVDRRTMLRAAEMEMPEPPASDEPARCVHERLIDQREDGGMLWCADCRAEIAR